jgi:hypothetical protein
VTCSLHPPYSTTHSILGASSALVGGWRGSMTFSRYNKQALYVHAQSYNIVIDIINSILERTSELALFKLPLKK